MAESQKPSVLSYAPLVYRHRQTKTAGFAVFTALAAIIVAALDWRHQGPPPWAQGLIVGTPALLTGCAFWFGWSAECRVEGGQLWFSAENIAPTSIPIVDLVAVDQVDTGDGFHFEIAVRDKGRMKVGPDVLRPIEPLRKVILAINPGVRFGRRPGTECGSCGAALVPTDRPPSVKDASRRVGGGHCPSCKRPFPRSGKFA